MATWGAQALKARVRAAGLILVIIDGQIRHRKPPSFNEDGLLAMTPIKGADLNNLVAHFQVFRTF